MQIKEFDVIQPPNAGELERRMKEGRLSSVVLDLIIRQDLDELAIRRGDENPEISCEMTVHYSQFGENPFLIGHIDEDVEQVARLTIVNEEGVADADRTLHLAVFDSEA